MPEVEVLVQLDTGASRRERLSLDGRRFTIGRHAQNAVRLEGDNVSREHALVDLLADRMRVEDASSNGTLAGSVMLRREAAELPYGTPVKIGSYTLVIGAATSPASHAPGGPEATIEVRREIHRMLLENLDLAKLDAAKIDDPSMRPRVLGALRRIVKNLDPRIAPEVDRDVLVGELADEALGLGPLERFLADPTISEIMVVDPATIYVERAGALTRVDARFTDDERVRAVIERIVTPLGRRIDESSPLVDARLRDGSRVNAVIRPLALRGSCVTIRRFPTKALSLERLVAVGALTEAMGRFLVRSVAVRRNIVISGGTGSGKTTLLNVLSAAIPDGERIITIEDAAELQLAQPHVVPLETRPPNMEGKGEYTIRDLVRNALRMRPDRIVVGECRGGEALDMLQAMNTGHDGSLTTTHANSPAEALARLETLAMMAGIELPARAIREQIATSIHLVVQVARMSDGTRKVTCISEVAGLEEAGALEERPIFEFCRTGTGPDGKVLGVFRATGYLPSFLDQFIVQGLVRPGGALPMSAVDLALLKWAGSLLVVTGAFVWTMAAAGSPDGWPRRLWAGYVELLEGRLRRMYRWTSGHKIAGAQVAFMVGCAALRVLVGLPAWYLLAAAGAVVPPWWIERMRRRRVVALEGQIDGFLVALSNALKATPSVADAFQSVGALLPCPMCDEIATALKEVRFGSTLEEALSHMAARVGSAQLDAALSTVLIGRQIGGNLPKILDATAGSLREMGRLEGVVRTKTAEGKMQVWVLAVFPMALVMAISAISPGTFDPLTESPTGFALIAMAVLFWASGLLVARRILAVDI